MHVCHFLPPFFELRGFFFFFWELLAVTVAVMVHSLARPMPQYHASATCQVCEHLQCVVGPMMENMKQLEAVQKQQYAVDQTRCKIFVKAVNLQGFLIHPHMPIGSHLP